MPHDNKSGLTSETDEVTSLSEDKDDSYSNLGSLIESRLKESEQARLYDEKRWLRSYRNYRGIYGSDMAFRDSEKSKVFVKVTKTKVLASYGQLIEVLFSQGKFPIGIQPTSDPLGIAKYAHIKPDNLKQQDARMEDIYGFEGDGREISPGATADEIFNGLKDKYAKGGFDEGPAPDLKTMPQVEPANEAAKNMETLIHDQLEESHAISVMRHVLFEMCLLGTGILKGPFNYEQSEHKWTLNDEGEREYKPISKLVPRIEAVSCWDLYPDPDAVNIEDADYIIQRHIFTRTQIRDLVNRPFFRKSAINDLLEGGPNYETRSYETALFDRENQEEFNKNRFEVLEYWGTMDKALVEEAGIEMPDEISDDLDEVQINAWISNGQILRLVLNPFTPARNPFMVCPYEINPYQFFGVGIPENMDDAQTIMNGHARMAIDNLALAGNLVFDVDETMLVPGQDMTVYPGKIFRRQSGQTGQAIHGLRFPNTAPENMQMFDRFRQLADESTGIPSYSHGQTGIQSTTRTASGMSMLMGAAALNIKTVIKNIDDYLLKPLGESFFHWNMQFNKDIPEIQGDLDVKARGTSSLMMKEVRSQRLMTFMQVASNQFLAPFVKWHSIIKEIAKSLDVDPDQVVNDPEQAAIFMKLMGEVNGNQQTQGNNPQQGGMGLTGGVPAGANVADTQGSGGSNIGVGTPQVAGESGFTAPDNEPQGAA
tara:strand:+ start:464 stop:2593 length:2130 start_codon:yes stop_codon:yes gene_type:complete